MITEAKIEEIDGEFVVSHGGTWVEGLYATKNAALAALTLSPDVLHRLWEKHKPEPLTEAQIGGAA